MFMNWYDKATIYFALHPNLNATAHFAAGFGLAILLQHYINGHALLPAVVGWILVLFSAVVHFIAMK